MTDVRFDTTYKFQECPVCGYSLRGHTGEFHCPECGQEYDEHTRLWISEYTWFDLRSFSKLPWFWLTWMAAMALLRVFLGTVGQQIAVVASITVVVLCLIAVRIFQRSEYYPFVLVGENGVTVSRVGLPRRNYTLSWDEVERRVSTVGSGWKFADGITRSLGVRLDSEGAKTLRDTIHARVECQRKNGVRKK